MMCSKCRTPFRYAIEGAARVTVHVNKIHHGEVRRCTAYVDMCPVCFSETEMSEYKLDYKPRETKRSNSTRGAK